MQELLFVIPMKDGKLDAFRAFGEVSTGPKAAEYRDMLKRYGLRNARVWHHRGLKHDYALVVHEAEDDALERLGGFPNPDHPFDKWYAEQCLDAYDVISFQEMPGPSELLYSFEAY